MTGEMSGGIESPNRFINRTRYLRAQENIVFVTRVTLPLLVRVVPSQLSRVLARRSDMSNPSPT